MSESEALAREARSLATELGRIMSKLSLSGCRVEAPVWNEMSIRAGLPGEEAKMFVLHEFVIAIEIGNEEESEA